MKLPVCCLAFFLATAAALPAYAYEVPANDGFVTDEAAVLSQTEEGAVERMLAEYREQTSNEIAILILPTLIGEDIADVALEVGRKWGVGGKENDNGVLVVINYTEREMYIAVGYGLEGALPDLATKGIIDTDIVPHFREGKYFEGLVTGIQSIQKHITGEYTADRYLRQNEQGSYLAFLFFFLSFFFEFIAAFLARSRSWWLGGVLGAVCGLVLTLVYSWWLSIPILTLVGLLFDYVLSKNYKKGHRSRSGYYGGGSGGRRGGGGFGGFGGGSFGGGGARGRW